jgi:hypothetical protein
MPELSVIIDLLSLLAIVSGVVFGLAEIRRARQVRTDLAAVNIFTSLLQTKNIGVVSMLLQVPENASAEFFTKDPELINQSMQVSLQIESWGFLVFKGNIDLRTLDYMVGGVVRKLWNRLHNLIFFLRQSNNDPSVGEWFQWLAEHLESDPAPRKAEGAYEAFRDWKRKKY